MTTTISQLFTPTQLPAAAAVLYTVPAAPATTILRNGRVRLTNTTGAAQAVTLHVDAAASATGAGNCFLSAVSLAANASVEVDVPVLKAGDTLRGFASAAASVTLHLMDGVLIS